MFGKWVNCVSGWNHYQLGRSMLCGGRAKPSGESVPKSKDGINNPNWHCPDCKLLNAERWRRGDV